MSDEIPDEILDRIWPDFVMSDYLEESNVLDRTFEVVRTHPHVLTLSVADFGAAVVAIFSLQVYNETFNWEDLKTAFKDVKRAYQVPEGSFDDKIKHINELVARGSLI